MSKASNLGAPFSVRLPGDLRGRVDALADATRRTRGDIVREALEREIAHLEREQRLVARVADLRAGREITVSLD